MAEHAKSEGARYERAAVRSYLRRQIKKYNSEVAEPMCGDMVRAIQGVLDWVLTRQQRYDKAPGGLGRTVTAKKDTKSRKR